MGILVTRIAMFPLGFLVSVFVAVDLGAGGYGIYQFLLLFVGPVLHILSFGLGGGVTYLVGSQAFRPRDVVLTCIVAGLGIGAIGVVLIGGLWTVGKLGVIGSGLPVSQVVPMLCALPFYAVNMLFYRLAMGASWFKTMNAIDLAKAISAPLILFVLVIALGLGVEGAVYAILFNGLFTFVVLFGLILRKGRPRATISGSFLSASARYGARAWIGDVAAQAYNRLDHLLFGFLASESLFGIYVVAARVTELLWLPTTAMGPVLFNRIASEDDGRERIALTGQTHRVVFGIVLVSAVLLAANLWWFIPIVYQGAYDASVVPALILIPGTILMVTQKVLTKYFSGTNRPGVSSGVTALGAVAIGVLAFVFIPRYGPSGAALASTAAYVLMALVSIVVYRRMIAPVRPRLFAVGRGDIVWLKIRVGDALRVWRDRLPDRAK